MMHSFNVKGDFRHDEEKGRKCAKLVADIKLAEPSACIGLEDVRTSNTLTPPKTSTHPTNLSSRENATTISALLSSGVG